MNKNNDQLKENTALIQPNHGYHVHGWMTGLGLSLLELNLYAIICGGWKKIDR